MKINIKDLNECPVLSAYKRELIKRVYVNGETQSAVAKSLKKDPSTISIQLKKALAKFDSWIQSREKRDKVSAEEDFGKKIFRLFRKGKLPDAVIAEIGRPDEVISLWEKYLKLKKHDYYTALSKLADHGFETNESSDYPVSDLMDDILWKYFEREDVWDLLEEKGFTKDLDKETYGSITDSIQLMYDTLLNTQIVLAKSDREKETTVRELEDTKQALKHARQEILKLKRLEKYEELSEEQREKLRTEIAQAQRFIENLNQKIEQLQTQKASLVKEINLIKQIERDAARNIQKLVYEYIADCDFKEVMKLYSDALKSKLYGTTSVD